MNLTITAVLFLSLSTLNLIYVPYQIVDTETSPLFVISTIDNVALWLIRLNSRSH